MISLPAMPRLRGVELLDDPAVSGELMIRSMSDVARANALFGGRRAAIEELRLVLPTIGTKASMLDVGTGRGDIPAAARIVAKDIGVDLWTVGLDLSLPLVKENRGSNDVVALGDAIRLPFSDKSIDVVMSSQMLHHFQFEDAVKVVVELNRVARKKVIVSDLRRSVFAAAGIWAASFPLGFHPVSRHDGVVSVMRGFTPNELTEIVKAAAGIEPVVRHRLGFRLTASWTPGA
ncbi:MAG TPA: methyltransferase domain-containing protein [Gemmatimonadaceae bacterium]|nr:methyltransferase domain-containing protein [Gemmatimonadaceae bacterium]